MIDLRVYGDPAACRGAAQSGRAVATAVTDARSDADSAKSRSAGAWTGGSGEGFRSTVGDLSKDLGELAGRIKPACEALDTFADELSVVKDTMTRIRGEAAAAGLTVTGDGIAPPGDAPADLGPDATPQQATAHDTAVAAYNKLVAAYNNAVGEADDARSKESSAHHHLTSAMKASNGDGWFENLMEKLGFAPPDGMDGWDAAAWGLGLGGLGFGLASSTMLNGVLQTFQPRVAGRFGSTAGMSFFERLAAAGRSDSWHAKAYQAISRDKWATAGKWAGRAGTVVTAATSAWDQWKDDADDPSLDTGERVDRAATKGAATAAGAWAGAEAGAWVGGAIGTAICPGVGTVVGGAVGGLIGGFAGSSAGGWLGDQINDATDGIGHAVADVGSGIADAASDVGDAISFWD